MRQRFRASGDEGVSLIETVVAMLVFTAFAGITGQILLSTLKTQENNTQRVAAANLAAQQIELVRGTPVLDLPDGLVTLPVQPTLAGTTYTLTQDVAFVAGQSGGSVCASTTNSLTYKKVSVAVTWPNMGSVKPVRSDTVKVLGLGPSEADVRKGAGAVGVIDANNQPQSGVLVSLTPSGRQATTGADGCVVFPNLDPAITHTAKLSRAGYVDPDGDPAPTSPINVLAGKVVRSSLSYASKGSLQVTMTAPAGYNIPAGLGVTLDSSRFTPTNRRAFPLCVGGGTQNCVGGSASSRIASALFPLAYTAWAGTCADARPTTPPSVTVAGGGFVTTTSALGALYFRIDRNTYDGVLYAAHRPSSGSCQAGEVFQMTRVAPGEWKLALPPGTWDIALRPDGQDVGSYGLPSYVITSGQVRTAP